jgi:hypothetical protein
MKEVVRALLPENDFERRVVGSVYCGFDVPECYAIKEDQKMYYALFTPPHRAWGLDKPPGLPPSNGRARIDGTNAQCRIIE